MFQIRKNNRREQVGQGVGRGQAGRTRLTWPRGQAMVEFALILLVLLAIIFVIIEAGRIFQANLTVQNAARAAGRYAITGEFDPSCLADTPPCENPRLESIKNVAVEQLAGLRLNPNAAFEQENYYLVEVYGLGDSGNWVLDYVGGPGDAVLVRVTYRLGIVTPLLNAIARTVRVRGQVVYNNEQFRQTSLTSGENPGNDDAPNLPPLPTTGPTPTSIPEQPVLAITKTASVDEIELGTGQITYNIEIGNSGAGPATNVVFTDTLPNLVRYSSGAGGCSVPASEPAGGEITCPLGGLAPGASTSVSFSVDPQGDGVATNTATVSSNEVGPVSDSASTTILNPAAADLDLRKETDRPVVAQGEEFEYVVRIRNLGLAQATNVIVTDTLPSGIAFVSASPSQGSCPTEPAVGGTGPVICELGSLAPDGAATIFIRVQATEAGQITNTATATANEDDPNPGNNTSQAVVSVDPAADMVITKTVQPEGTVGAGEFMTYTLEVTNLGPNASTSVTVTDDLPVGVGLVSMSTTVGTCEQQPDVTAEIICYLGTMDPGVTETIEIVAIPTGASLAAGQPVVNTARVGADQYDPDIQNNTSSIPVTVEPRADLAITKDVSDPLMERVHVDDSLVYELVVTNEGDSITDAPAVFITDTLDLDAVTFSNATFSGSGGQNGSCDPPTGSGLISCDVGDMAIGDTVTVIIEVSPRAQANGDGAGEVVNTAGVYYGGGSDYEDADESNNFASITTYIGPGAEAITLSSACGDPGDAVTVSGTGWTTSSPQEVTLIFDPAGNFETTYTLDPPVTVQSDGTWSASIDIPAIPNEEANWGEYTILAEGRTDEEAEAPFQFPCPKPDLFADNLGEPVGQQVVAGEAATFTVDITNLASDPVFNADAGAFSVGLYYFEPVTGPATDADSIAGSPVATVDVPGLAVGEVIQVTFEVSHDVPDQFPDYGLNDVYVMVDPESTPGGIGAIDERLENNNITGPLAIEVLARPVAVDDSITTLEDEAVLIDAAGNDTDADGNLDPNSAVVVTGPSNGTVVNNGDGTFTYTPTTNHFGGDSFTYEVCDTTASGPLCDTGSVSIDIEAVNDDPVANPDSASTDEDTPVTVDVLANDSDVDGDALTISSVTDPANGTASIDGTTVSYTPDADFNGSDTFDYTIIDGNGGTGTATVTITVDPVNDAPMAEDDAYSVDEDVTLSVSAPGVLGNDRDVDDPLSISSNTVPANGSLTFSLGDGSFTYTPNADFCGSDSFTYTLDDGNTTDTATVSITVDCINDIPVAADDTTATGEDNDVVVNVLANDSDPDGDPLSVSVATQPANGSATVVGNTIAYNPNLNFCGSGDSFTYMISDGNGGSDTATVTVTNVTCVNDAPVAIDDNYNATVGTQLIVPAPGVLGNDTDVDDATLSAVLDTGPSGGMLTLNSDGSFTYTPPATAGTYTFTYMANDGSLNSSPATVTVTVSAP